MLIKKMIFYIDNEEYEKAINLFHNNEDILLENMVALYYMGVAVERCYGMYIEYNGSIEYYIKSANYGYIPAKYRLAEYYFYLYKEYLDIEDLESFRQYILDAALGGHALAQCVLAELYCDGRYIEEDYLLAKKYYKMSAEAGCKEALYKMAYFYETGILFEYDINNAIEFYILATEKDYDLAIFKLGTEYLYGDLIDHDYEKAFNYLERYIEIIEDKDYNLNLLSFVSEDDSLDSIRNMNTAKYLLAYMYEKGIGCEEDIDKAVKLYNSIKYGYLPSLYRLLIIYSNDYVEHNIKEKILYDWLVDLVNGDFFILIDRFSEDKIRFYLDESTISIRLLNKLIDEYVPIDKETRFNFYRLLFINNKIIESSYQLGKLYSTGYPYKNMKKAIYYFEVGAVNGCLDCSLWLGKYYLKKNPKLAFEYIKSAANSSDSKAKYEYGYMLYNGIGCDKNEELAIKVLNLGISLGSRRCKLLLNELLK